MYFQLNILCFAGDTWKTRRRMLNRSFTYKSLQQYNSSFNRHSDGLVEGLEALFSSRKVSDIDKLIHQCVFRVTSGTSKEMLWNTWKFLKYTNCYE